MPYPPDGSVIITPRQMYDELLATRQAVERLTNTVDPAIADIRADQAQTRTDVDTLYTSRNTLDRRVTIIETKLNAAWAAIGLLLAACGVLVALLAK